MVNFENFVELVREGLISRGHIVRIENTCKNNDVSLTTVILMSPDKNIFPNFYLDEIYPMYKEGKMSLEDVLERIEWFFDNNEPLFEPFEPFEPSSSSWIEKDKIVPRIVGKTENQNILKNALWLPVDGADDLIITFRVVMSTEGGVASAILKNNHWNHLNALGIEDGDVLLDIAKDNYKDIFGLRTIPIAGRTDDNGNTIPVFMAVTNITRLNGATSIIFKEYLDIVRDEMQCENLVIFPSSIHEILVMDKDYTCDDLSDAVKIVKEVNTNIVDAIDKLSDSIYLYDGECIITYNP